MRILQIILYVASKHIFVNMLYYFYVFSGNKEATIKTHTHDTLIFIG